MTASQLDKLVTVLRSNAPPAVPGVAEARARFDATAVAEKLHAAGGTVRLSVWPNMLRAFALFAPVLSEGRDACLEIGRFMRSHTALEAS